MRAVHPGTEVEAIRFPVLASVGLILLGAVFAVDARAQDTPLASGEFSLQGHTDGGGNYWTLAGQGQPNPTLTLQPGQTVIFRLSSASGTHNFKIGADAASAPFGDTDGQHDISWTAPGAQSSVTYICTIHGAGMSGTIHVDRPNSNTQSTLPPATPTPVAVPPLTTGFPSVSNRVVDVNSQPYPSLPVMLSRQITSDHWSSVAIEETNADGIYTFPLPADGTYTVSIMPDIRLQTIWYDHWTVANQQAQLGWQERNAIARTSAFSPTQADYEQLRGAFQWVESDVLEGLASGDTHTFTPLHDGAWLRSYALQPASSTGKMKVLVTEFASAPLSSIPSPDGSAERYIMIGPVDANGNDIGLQTSTATVQPPANSLDPDSAVVRFDDKALRWESTPSQVANGTITWTPHGSALYAIVKPNHFFGSSFFNAVGGYLHIASTMAVRTVGTPGLIAGGAGLSLLTVGSVIVLRRKRSRTRAFPTATAAVAAEANTIAPASALDDNDVIADSVRVDVGDKTLLSGVSFHVTRGQVLAVLGPSGAGKTTLLRALAGDAAHDGDILIFGKHPGDKVLKPHIAYVAQDPELYADRTLRENLEYFGQQYDLSRDDIAARTTRLAAALGLTERLETKIGVLSGGQKKRASLAVSLLSNPSLIILDEPSSGLDPLARRALWKHLREVRAQLNMAIIVTTHFIDEAELADTVLILNHGRTVAHGSPAELKRKIPGGGRGIAIELYSATNDIQTRIRAITDRLRDAGKIGSTDFTDAEARIYCQDPQRVGQEVSGALLDAGIPFRGTRVFDVTLQDVFVCHAGEAYREE